MAGLYEALLAFQKDAPKIEKDSTNTHYKNRYPTLDALMPVVLAALNKCGLVLIQLPGHEQGNPTLTTRVVHAETGEQVEATMSLLTAKHDPQGQGSALTYARRYALMSFLGLVADEDTDGQPASGNAGPAKRRPRPEAKKAVSASAAGNTPTGEPPDSVFISAEQVRELWTLKTDNGVSDGRFKEILQQQTGQQSTRGVTQDVFEAVRGELELEGVPFE